MRSVGLIFLGLLFLVPAVALAESNGAATSATGTTDAPVRDEYKIFHNKAMGYCIPQAKEKVTKVKANVEKNGATIDDAPAFSIAMSLCLAKQWQSLGQSILNNSATKKE